MINALLSNYLGSFIRHGLSVVAGVLVTKGVIDAPSSTAFINSNTNLLLGIGSYAIAQGSSLLAKKVTPPTPAAAALPVVAESKVDTGEVKL